MIFYFFAIDRHIALELPPIIKSSPDSMVGILIFRVSEKLIGSNKIIPSPIRIVYFECGLDDMFWFVPKWRCGECQ